MTWDYAELSKSAKDAGGPENLVRMIEEGGKADGRVEGRYSMIPWIGFTALVSSALTVGVMKLIDYFKAKKVSSQSAIEKLKSDLIQGINDYDATHRELNKNEKSEKGEESNG